MQQTVTGMLGVTVPLGVTPLGAQEPPTGAPTEIPTAGLNGWQVGAVNVPVAFMQLLSLYVFTVVGHATPVGAVQLHAEQPRVSFVPFWTTRLAEYGAPGQPTSPACITQSTRSNGDAGVGTHISPAPHPDVDLFPFMHPICARCQVTGGRVATPPPGGQLPPSASAAVTRAVDAEPPLQDVIARPV